MVEEIMGMSLDFIKYLLDIFPFIIISVVLAIFLVIIAIKTPAFIFLKASISGRTILEVRRKDRTEFVLGSYGAGILQTKKYGSYIMDEVSPMKKGGRICWVTDTEGITLRPDILRTISGIQKQYGLENIEQVQQVLNNWHTCSCGFEGVPSQKFKKDIETYGEIKKEKKVFVGWECPKAKKGETHTLKKVYPDIIYLPYKTISTENLRKYHMYDFTPTKMDSLIQQKVSLMLGEERRFNMKYFSILLGVGLLILLVFIAISYLNEHSLLSDPNKIQEFCAKIITCPQCLCT